MATRLPASAKQRAINPIAAAHTPYARGAPAPSDAATPAGRRKMPPPTVTLTMLAANPQAPKARTSEGCFADAVTFDPCRKGSARDLLDSSFGLHRPFWTASCLYLRTEGCRKISLHSPGAIA